MLWLKLSLVYQTLQKMPKHLVPMLFSSVIVYTKHGICTISCYSTNSTAQRPHVILYFQGDMQNMHHVMSSHKDDDVRAYSDDYCLESTVNILANKLECTHVVMIEPRMVHNLIYAVYDTFVKYSDSCGNCERSNDDGRAISSLCSIVSKVQTLLKLKDEQFSLCGFSKGGIVLNNLVQELHLMKEHRAIMLEYNSILAKVKQIHWIDGGNEYQYYPCLPNDQQSIQIFAKLCHRHDISVFVHVTPYTLYCEDYVENELNDFTQEMTATLNDLNKISAKGYFKVSYYFMQSDEAQFSNHFKCLKEFITEI
jgi:hypothetical protein